MIDKKKPLILGVRKMHFFTYLITLLIGIISSYVVIIIGTKYNNSFINYLISLTASLVVTSIFAYFIDLANNRENISEIKKQRQLVLTPIINSIITFFFRIIPLYSNADTKVYNLSDIEKEIHEIIDKYVNCIKILSTGSRDLSLVNESFSIKYIEIYSIRELENKLLKLLNEQEVLVMKEIISRNEFALLEILYKDIVNTKFPYLDSENDRNISKAYVDWPKNELREIDINNLHTQFKILFLSLDKLSKNIKEFSFISNIKIDNV